MKKKTVAPLKSLKIDRSFIMTLNAASHTTGGKDPAAVIDTILHTDPTTEITGITACGCPPRMTEPPFCIF